MSLLLHGSKVVDVLQASLEIGLFDALDEGEVTLGMLSTRCGAVPSRLYKLLDCLETVGLVERSRTSDEINETVYRAVEPLKKAALQVIGPESIERDRDRHPWRAIHGRLTSVVRGEGGIPSDSFKWPPETPDQVASFETSMAVGCPPIIESFLSHRDLWSGAPGHSAPRVLDVGGGDGTLAAALLHACPGLSVDVYNLPAVRPLIEQKIASTGLGGRLGFVGGDFLAEDLPSGYGVVSFVRVLHDWPDAVARSLIEKAFRALSPGGRLLICEEFRTPDRLAIQFFWSYFLIGLDDCVSRLREASFYIDALTACGFGEARVHQGPFEIISAVKT